MHIKYEVFGFHSLKVIAKIKCVQRATNNMLLECYIWGQYICT